MKINFVSRPSYAEEGQPNPIRWAILSGTPETGFVNETSWLKCKDFFNDYCYTYNTGKKMAIYGFDTGSIKVAKKGEPVYIAVKDVTTWFPHNVMKCTNVPVHIIDGMYVLEFEPKYFQNTYNISLISLIIRLCNTDQEFKSFDELAEFKEFPQKDQQKWNEVVKKGVFFNLPEKLQKYVWYAGDDCNSEAVKDGYSLASLCHNSGCISYGRYM